jgi:hypothetical protein
MHKQLVSHTTSVATLQPMTGPYMPLAATTAAFLSTSAILLLMLLLPHCSLDGLALLKDSI